MARTFHYTREDIRNPEGANNLSALAMYYQRSLYREVIYPGVVSPVPIDTWYDKGLYGKVDRFQNTILLKNEKIEPVMTVKKDRIYAADNVVASFEAFSGHMARANFNGRLNNTTDGNLAAISAAAGWTCPKKAYAAYVENLFQGFMRYYVEKRHDQIEGFKTFIPIITSFLKMSANILPVTMTNVILTDLVSPMVSGLSIKIADFDAGDDKIKYEKFISNPNFDFYVSSAKKFGLIVNKYMPWILTADLFTEASLMAIEIGSEDKIMKLYEERFPNDTVLNEARYAGLVPTEATFFSDYYDLACLEDIPNLKKIFVNFYNRYIEIQPLLEKKVFKGPACGYKTNVTLHERVPTSMSELDALMTDFDWIDLYINLREIESEGTPLKTNFLRRIAREKYKIIPRKNHTPLENAALYVNSVYRKYLYSQSYLTNLYYSLTNAGPGATMSIGNNYSANQ